APGAAAGTWAVQVGAFLDRDVARQTARKARALIPSVVGTGAIHVEPSRVRGGPIYQQARIVNLGREEAYRACTLLKQRNFRCMVVRLPAPVATPAAAATGRILGAPSPKPEILRDLSMRTMPPAAPTAAPPVVLAAAVEPSAQVAQAAGWGVQLGAFRQHDPALRVAADTAEAMPVSLPQGAVTVVERVHAGTTLYLARVHGLSRDQASASCADLKRRGLDCLVVPVTEMGDVDAAATPAVAAAETAAAVGRAGDWAIQVGAFPQQSSARSVAERARNALPETLSPGTIRIAPLDRRRGGTMYQARIVGIDQTSAQTACRLLSLQQFDCLVMRSAAAS
ncbi:MAG: SPOR domain-containing protein, partial [Rhodospirillales bacterium]